MRTPVTTPHLSSLQETHQLRGLIYFLFFAWLHYCYFCFFQFSYSSYRPSKSHGFAVGLTVLTSISWSHGYWSLSHSKVKSITRPKNCLVFKKQQWLCSAVMLKLSTGCANIRLPHRIEKKQSGKSNERKPGFFNKGNHRLEKQVFSILSHRNLPSTRISRFLAKSPVFLGIFFGSSRFWQWQGWKVCTYLLMFL